MTGKQRAGRQSRVGVGTPQVFLCYASWDSTASADDYSTVNMESYNAATGDSYDEGLHGPVGADVKYGGDWDAGTPGFGTAGFGSPPGLYPRDDLANVNFIVNRLDNVPWAFPYQRVRSSQNGGDVKGKVTFSVSGKNQGVFSYPSTAV